MQSQYYNTEIQLLKSKRKNDLIKKLDLYLDDCDIIRCGGRLKYAKLDYETKYPILLPGKSYLAKLIILETYDQLCHANTTHTLTKIRK